MTEQQQSPGPDPDEAYAKAGRQEIVDRETIERESIGNPERVTSLVLAPGAHHRRGLAPELRSSAGHSA